MPIAITGKNIELGDSLREFVTQQLHSVVEQYMGDILEAQVVFSKDHHVFKLSLIHI